MTRHLDAVSVTEHRVVLALAREFADRAELAEAAIQRVREQLHKPWKYECECCTRIWIALEGDSDD